MSDPAPRFLLTVRKWDVIDTLRRRHGLQVYLQILSPSTGTDMPGRPELNRFAVATTYLYACDQQRREMPDAAPLPTLRDIEQRYRTTPAVADIVFIDNWHSYDDSRRALAIGLQAVRRGGFIVMHDCDPPDWDAANPVPESCTALYCGEAWRAFVDTVVQLPEGARWFVVESDLGIGVIEVPAASRVRRARSAARRQVERAIRRRLPARRRRLVPGDGEAAWNWLVEHRTEVLHPVSIREWQAMAESPEATPWPVGASALP